MADAAFWLSAACAVAGALCGNRTSSLLLASAALCVALDELGVAFHFIFWLLIDLVVIRGIIRPQMTNADVVILALFIPAWVFYLLPDPPRFTGTMIVVCAQLILTFPFERARAATTRLVSDLKKNDDAMMKVA